MDDFPPGAEPMKEPLEGRCLCRAVTITLEGARPLVDVAIATCAGAGAAARSEA